jgi:hypothetical protein
MSNPPTSEAIGVGTGGVKILPRLNRLTLLLGMILLYQAWGGSWWVLAIPLLASSTQLSLPTDRCQDRCHPAALLPLGFAAAEPLTLSIAMIGSAISASIARWAMA